MEWALSQSRASGAPHIVTELDEKSRAIFARNPYSNDFAGHIAFVDMGGRQTTWTGDRREFLGRNGTPASPAAMWSDEPLSQLLGGGLDPCGVLHSKFIIAPGEDTEVVLLLGQATDRDAARALIAKYRNADAAAVLAEVMAFWDAMLGTLEIRTPDRAMDLLVNRWLPYQTLSCRVWGRAGFYQASGAYGFRDQLQDTMALCVSQPALVREHLATGSGPAVFGRRCPTLVVAGKRQGRPHANFR